MATDKELNDDLYGGDLYADLDLEELDATQLEEELEDVPDLQPLSEATPTASNAQAQPAYNQQQQSQPQQQQFQPQQQQGQFGFGSTSGQGSSGGYGHGGEGIDRLRSGDQPDEGKMFIGGLNWETSEENLREYMGQYGPIEAVTIMRDPNGRSRGFAFLTYQNAESVNKVLAEVHHLDGKQIDPKRAIPRAEHERTAKVFVGGLAATVTSESLKNFLTQFGPVMDATVMFDRETGRSKGFAFATFGNEESVGVAMAASGVELEGKSEKHYFIRVHADFQIEIKKAQPRGSGNLPIKFPGQGGGVSQPATRGAGMGMMGGAQGMGMGMGMGAMGNMGASAGAFDPTAMMMMYQNMMKSSGMGNMAMGGGVDPTAMAMMYQNMMKNMAGMNAPAINPSMARGGMGMMNPMAGMMGGMGMAGMAGMAPGMGMGGYGGQAMGVARPPAAGARAVPNAPRGPAAMRTEGGITPTGAAAGTGAAGPGAQRYSTQGAARSRPY